jgi:hypothetical protein
MLGEARLRLLLGEGESLPDREAELLANRIASCS